MEPLFSIVTAIGALLALATAAINLVTAIRTRHGGGQERPEDGQEPGR